MVRVSNGTIGVIAMGKSDNHFYRFIYYIYKRLPTNSTIRDIANKYMDADIALVHAPSIYDFRKRDIKLGPISDVIPENVRQQHIDTIYYGIPSATGIT